MKNRLVFMSLLLSGCCTLAMAQSGKHYYSERFQDNLFISVGVGGQTCLNPDNKDYGFSHSITPQLSLSIGKWINPVWGVRLQGAGIWSKLNQKFITKPNEGALQEDYYGYKNKFVQTRIDGLFNISNALCGYNPDRFFTVSLFMGPGLTFAKTYLVKEPQGVPSANGLEAKDAEQKSDMKALITGSLGLTGAFNVSKNWDINLEIRGDVSPSIYGKKGAETEGAVAALVGATYTFGRGKHFVASATCNHDIDALNAEINRYREQLAAKEAELERAKANANVKPEVRTEVKEVVIAGKQAFFFRLGGSTLSKEDRVNVKLIAEHLKANPSVKYKVAGYADQATGNDKINQTLSEKRAQAVADALVAEGVDKDQLEVVGCGATPNMFGEDRLNRIVILESR